MTRSTRRLPVAVSLTAAALLLSACGSTVQLTSDSIAAAGGGALSADGTPVDALGGVAAADGSDAGQSGAAPASGTAAGSTGSTTTSGGSSGTRPAAGGAATGTSGRSTAPKAGSAPAAAGPVSTAPVEVGFVIFPDAAAFSAALGGSGNGVGDQKGQINTAVAWANAQGGLAGRKIVPVFFEVELTSSQPYSVTYQQICDSFTQDHKVVAAVIIANADNSLPACLGRKGVLTLASGHFLHDPQDYRPLPYLVTPREAGTDRAARTLLAEMQSAKLLEKGAGVGLLIMDYGAPNRTAEQVIAPALKARGVKLTTFKIPPPQSTPGISDSVAAVQSATLKMAAQGVKTVMFLCPGCANFFLQNAESQAYYPRYVLSSLDGPAGLAGSHERSLSDAIALGWEPSQDVGTYTHPEVVSGNPSRTLCKQVQKAQINSDESEFAALSFCGALVDLRAFAQSLPTGSVTGPQLAQGATRLGTSYSHAMSFKTTLTPSQRDGAAGLRSLRWTGSCTCFAFVGPVRPFG